MSRNIFLGIVALLTAGVVFVLVLSAIFPAEETIEKTAYAFEHRTTTVDGLQIHYRIGGKGPYLLMLHGFTMTGEQWIPFAEEFAGTYTVVVAELPGHGGSLPLPGDFSFERTARIMHGLMERLGSGQFYARVFAYNSVLFLSFPLYLSDNCCVFSLFLWRLLWLQLLSNRKTTR